ncbi:hypothetical protein GUJ93_ZPchr0006g45775 [Zizania palustris]|uniref:Uncharacterized protein n=1 Tax=Zizania palustris TaxID=103762 RepID=A0A8J5TDQ0_ZIZPA|nr:hypothetical protein GUJ93_ZPchr0006g45775 [Zizania palustris]KAG8077155.1 hypothetical protein GUJ93_ZPchr0006g45775 [Zizania palustris]KAG8077156.1 hypothetical protein GUJ93_ZPchr0006g45775 [Zizania palustris]KAG8077157.1 hypothetical protein GUJ93_ZPchr0006g45775 [Zizania palustris]
MRGHDTRWDIGVSAMGLFPVRYLYDVLMSGCLRMRCGQRGYQCRWWCLVYSVSLAVSIMTRRTGFSSGPPATSPPVAKRSHVDSDDDDDDDDPNIRVGSPVSSGHDSGGTGLGLSSSASGGASLFDGEALRVFF